MIRMPFTRCQDKYIMHGTGASAQLFARRGRRESLHKHWVGWRLPWRAPVADFYRKISPLRMTCSWYVHIGGSRHVKGWSLGCGLRQPQSNHRDIVINNWDFKSILTTSQLGNTVCLHWGNPSKSSKQAEKIRFFGFVWIHCRLTKDSQNHQDIGRCKRLKHWWLALAWTTDQNSGCPDRWGIYWTMAI